MSDTPKHTPVPWVARSYADHVYLYPTDSPDAAPVAMCVTDLGFGTGDAEFILRAVNAHEELLAACEAARAFGSQGETDDGISVSHLLDQAIAKAKGQA